MLLGSHGEPSWRFGSDYRSQLLCYPLWVREVEGIAVPAGGLVPGPLNGVPESGRRADPALAGPWRAWWCSAVRQHFELPDEEIVLDPDADGQLLGPDFGAVPAPLRESARRLWGQAFWDWHSSGRREAVRRSAGRGPVGEVVAEVEAEIGRRADPFELSVCFLDVADREIRRAGPRAFLVPEALEPTPAYRHWLHGVVRALA
ncbi:hypothetical protein ACFYNO_33350 [Kitasatospora sp. NPDC006697]|uniref:hypothetical protein n=1 Tax=Kitasatospora sp. NPDC006697 TaxID=3364020 RepID=UPI0036A78728